MSNYKVVLSKKAVKFLDRIPENLSEKILENIIYLGENLWIMCRLFNYSAQIYDKNEPIRHFNRLIC